MDLVITSDNQTQRYAIEECYVSYYEIDIVTSLFGIRPKWQTYQTGHPNWNYAGYISCIKDKRWKINDQFLKTETNGRI